MFTKQKATPPKKYAVLTTKSKGYKVRYNAARVVKHAGLY